MELAEIEEKVGAIESPGPEFVGEPSSVGDSLAALSD